MIAKRHKLLCIVGARPNFMKIAPLMRALRGNPAMETKLIHTGQHYDVAMNARFFEQLGIPDPDISLEVGAGSHAVQTAEIMRRFEPVVDSEQPSCILVVGDVNSTVACALVAAKKGVRVVHVEAGLRSRDRSMPEEINRLVTDQLSDRLYVTEAEAVSNLQAEGISADKIVFAGNVMIDTLLASRDQAVPSSETLSVAADRTVFAESVSGYGVVTLHRPSNVDDPARLAALLQVLFEVSKDLPIVFPVHPRTRQRIEAGDLAGFLEAPRILALPPIGYFEMLGLIADARLVMTDSGGLQEETTALGVPCLTLRGNTERPVTITQGTNTLVGTDPTVIRTEVSAILAGRGKTGRRPELWDGRAAERIAADLASWLSANTASPVDLALAGDHPR